jgi:hypothetical protein
MAKRLNNINANVTLNDNHLTIKQFSHRIMNMTFINPDIDGFL